MSGSWLGPRSVDGGIDEIPQPGPGRMWLCGKHLVGPDPEAALARVGAGTIVCLVERHELEHRYDSYLAWLDASDGERALWSPIHDLHAPPMSQALPLVDAVIGMLEEGRSLIVHCGAGIGRAGTLAAAVLIRRGIERDAALATVADHRPMAGPEVGAQMDLVVALGRLGPR